MSLPLAVESGIEYKETMAPSLQEIDRLMQLMHGVYSRIVPIEAEWNIRYSEGDLRPRIEHYHDAVRALTQSMEQPRVPQKRLGVEYLAYDLAQLRGIPSRPVGPLSQATQRAPGSAVAVMGSVSGSGATPSRELRQELAEYYRTYTVYFAALFAEKADRDFRTRTGEVDEAVSDIGLAEDLIAKVAAGTMSANAARAELDRIEHDELREQMMKLLQQQIGKKEHQAINGKLGELEKRFNDEKKKVAQAHMNYATGQLAVYEESKDMVKALANKGLNLAGKFVAGAVQQSAGQSRGR